MPQRLLFDYMPVNWEAQRDMDEDLNENLEMYAALAGESLDDDE